MSTFTLPLTYSRVKRVHSFHELVSTRFADGVNALCWQRTLPDGFGEIVTAISADAGITTLDEAALEALKLSPSGRAAVAILIADLKQLRDHGLSPVLDCISGYPRDDSPGPVPTDVYSFHADSATVEADTYLCTYHGATSEGLRNEESRQRVTIPETRAELLALYGGPDDDGFAEFLREQCFDLHYAAEAGAEPFAFGLGNLWRIAIDYPGSPVPPCIHRAPANVPGQPPRLLLIS